MAKEIPAGHVEVVWAYRPDDRSKQGKTEVLPRDVARQKVSEGLARYAPARPAEPDAEAEAKDAEPAKGRAAQSKSTA